MTEQSSIRWRMIALFCVSTGVLLAVCYAGFYLLFQRVVREQLDRRLGEIAAPIIADLAGDPNDKDVDLLNIPDEYFEVLDASSGRVLQRSPTLTENLPLNASPGFETVHLSNIGEVRAVVIPFHAGENSWLFVA